MRAGINLIIVKVEKDREDEISYNGSKIFLDSRFERVANTRIYGTVVSVGPFQGAANGGMVSVKYAGSPAIPNGDQIKYLVSDYDANIEIGDKLYFHFNIINPGNFLDEKEDGKYYFLQAQLALAVVKNGAIIPLFGRVLVRPFYSDEVEEIELSYGRSTWKIKGVVDKDTGIVKEVGDNPRYLHGVVAHRCSVKDPLYIDVKTGDHVLYTTDSEFENTIEGVMYYTMKQGDIFAKVVDNEIVPVGDYVKISPVIPDEFSRGFITPQKYREGVNLSGEVMSVGCNIDKSMVGKSVHFVHKGPLTMKIDGVKEWFIRYQDIFFLNNN